MHSNTKTEVNKKQSLQTLQSASLCRSIKKVVIDTSRDSILARKQAAADRGRWQMQEQKNEFILI